MRKTLTAMRKTITVSILTFAALGLIASGLTHVGDHWNPFSQLIVQPVQAQNNVGSVAFPRFNPAALTFTATSQTGTVNLGSVSSGVIRYVGTSVTTATFQFFASNDGGTNYIAIPYSTGAYTSNVLNTVTGASITQTANTAVFYYVNLANMTNFEIKTSGTFTGTSISFQLTASGNKGLL